MRLVKLWAKIGFLALCTTIGAYDTITYTIAQSYAWAAAFATLTLILANQTSLLLSQHDQAYTSRHGGRRQ